VQRAQAGMIGVLRLHAVFMKQHHAILHCLLSKLCCTRGSCSKLQSCHHTQAVPLWHGAGATCSIGLQW
jgi:hypothetical protein